MDPKTGIRVHVNDDATSQIRVVESLDPEVFGEALYDGLARTPALVARRTSLFARAVRLPDVLCRRGFGYLTTLGH